MLQTILVVMCLPDLIANTFPQYEQYEQTGNSAIETRKAQESPILLQSQESGKLSANDSKKIPRSGYYPLFVSKGTFPFLVSVLFSRTTSLVWCYLELLWCFLELHSAIDSLRLHLAMATFIRLTAQIVDITAFLDTLQEVNGLVFNITFIQKSVILT